MPVFTRDMTLSRVERFDSVAGEADAVLRMDEEGFRVLYERTARPLWAYLSRVTGDRQLADDLLQETYYRFLRAGPALETDAHRRNYLYRVATNLARDHERRRRVRQSYLVEGDERAERQASGRAANRAEARTDLRRAMAGLTRREREVLWLAYAEGSSHREIAEALGLHSAGIRVLLFRARRKLARLLHVAPAGLAGGSDGNKD